ncbi:MAG: hypothetical protein JW724_02860 [Candidatus Altiarchaeota archaeon]|nr:hypothetical protein [Candidatus Altiarchaeota archaeon]
MDEKTLKKIYGFLEQELLEKLEYPCDHCTYFECEKNPLNAQDIIKNKYKWNDIDHSSCLKNNRERLKELMDLLRHPAFSKWSNEECLICGVKDFKHDMKLHMEIEERPKNGYHRAELFSLCKRCHKKYLRRKKPVHEGYGKM